MQELTLYPNDTEKLCELLNSLEIPYAVDDPNELAALLDETREYWDYFDESITAARPATVKIYDDNPELLGKLEPFINRYETRAVSEEDWANSWKPYWQAVNLGENLVIAPSWKTVIRLDPGMLFGTGAHASTAMCLEAAERLFGENAIDSVLDLGCGSGILTIASMLLGARTADGVDIDPNMPKVAYANAKLNGVSPNFTVADIFSYEPDRKYDLIFANIVADVIIRLIPKISGMLSDGGVFVCSGIIDGRSGDVEVALGGLDIAGKYERDGWVCYAVRMRGTCF